MRLVHKNWEQQVEFKENIVNTIVIENKNYFRELVLELFNSDDLELNNFSLLLEAKNLELSKNIIIINDVFNYELNNKKVTAKILTNLQNIAIENYEYTLEIKNRLVQYFSELSYQSDYNLDFEADIDISNLLKLGNFKVDSDYDSFLEKFLVYLKTLAHIADYKVIVILNSRLYFSEDELKQIYHYATVNKINILNLEYYIQGNYNKIADYEKIIIFDKDLCEL